MRFFFLIVAIFVAIAFTGEVTRGDAQEAVPEANPLIVGCAAAANLAAVQNLSLTRCRQVSVTVDGNTAFVTVLVWLAGQGKFTVSLVLYRTEWSQQYLGIEPA